MSRKFASKENIEEIDRIEKEEKIFKKLNLIGLS